MSNSKEKILLGFSSDCVGPNSKPDHLISAWFDALNYHTNKDAGVGHFNHCEIPTFPMAYAILNGAVRELGVGQIGLHGKIGSFKGEYPGGFPIVHNTLDLIMADELTNKTIVVDDPRVRYQLIHAERLVELLGQRSEENVYKDLAIPGKTFMVENGPVSGSFVKAVELIKRGNEFCPGSFGLMIDWLHLIKDVGDVGRAEEMALEMLSHSLFDFGEHGAFGERMDDSHSLDAVNEFKRLYQIGARFRNRLLLRVIETQYNTTDYLRLDLGFIDHIRQRNLQLVEFLQEELGWI